MYRLYFTKQAELKEKTQALLDILTNNPYQNIPSYEKLIGDLKGTYSRRITIQYRLVYQIIEEESAIKVIRIWTHYE